MTAMTDYTPDTDAASNGDSRDAPEMPDGQFVAVPLALANAALQLLAEQPYAKVADVANQIRGLPVHGQT